MERDVACSLEIAPRTGVLEMVSAQMQLVVPGLLIIFCLKPKHASVPRLGLSGFPSQPDKPLLILRIYVLIGFTTYPKLKQTHTHTTDSFSDQ